MELEIYGNNEVVGLVEKMVKKGREQRSVIIYGDKGLGKKTFARYIAASFLCEEHSGRPCGKCKSCRMLMRGVHPDYFVAKANGNGNYIIDESIRPIVADSVVMPNESRYKVYVIPDLDMSVNTAVAAQNILLKLIEEPPEHVVVILTARSKEIFLPTIISRVLSLGMISVEDSESRKFLEENFPDKTSEEYSAAVEAGRGNIGRCVEYLNQSGFYLSVEAARVICDAAVTKNEYKLLKAFMMADGKKQLLRESLVLFSEIVRDACVYRVGDVSGDMSLSCYEKGAKNLSEMVSAANCTALYELLCEFIKRIDANCNLSLTVNSLAGQICSMLK